MAARGGYGRRPPTPTPQRMTEDLSRPPAPGKDLWVFAYGSLTWDPGFPFEEARPALLRGYHRAFCLYSTHYRGTPERPGLVLGLDRGGACRGHLKRLGGCQPAAGPAADGALCRRIGVMKILREDVWKRRGISLLWGAQGLSAICKPEQVRWSGRGAVSERAELVAVHGGLIGISSGEEAP